MVLDVELKAGHLPAVKVGGVRVVQHRRKSETGEDKEKQEQQVVLCVRLYC